MARYQPPGGRGPQPKGLLPPRQLPPPDPILRQYGLTAVVLGGLSLLGLALGLGNLHRGIYVVALTTVFAVTAIVIGVGTNRRARRSGTARPRGAVSGIVLGGFGLAFSAFWLMIMTVFWPQLNTYYNCMNGADTVAAQQACHSQLNKSMGSELNVLQGGK
jgi:hypothetical protein